MGATALLEEGLRLYQSIGAVGGIAYSLLHLGGVARIHGDAAGARVLVEQSLALYQSTGDRSDVAYATGALAGLAMDDGDLVRARALADECVGMFRQLGDTRGTAEELRLLGRIAALQTDYVSAAEAYAECITLNHVLRELDVAFCLEGLAFALARLAAGGEQQNQICSAIRGLAAAEALRETYASSLGLNWSVSLPVETHADYAQELAATRAAVDGLVFEAAWAAGRQLSLEAACSEALNCWDRARHTVQH